MIKVGEAIPDVLVTIMGEEGPKPVSTQTLFGQGLSVVFATPGAFTPTCSAQHLPGFVEKRAELKDKGVDRVACVAVNDVFVVNAWAQSAHADDAIIMVADGNGEFVKALGLDMDLSAFGMGQRCHRFAMILRDGKVESLLIETPGEFKVSSAESVLQTLE